MNNNKFIKTTNKDTYEIMKKLGFNLISSSENEWVFINEPNKIVFGNVDDIIYTNILSI